MATGTVLCLGGSMTVGDDANPAGFRTYRGTLQTELSTAGLVLNFIGPNSAAAASGGNDPHHAGYAGASIDSTGSASNNLTSRLSAIRSEFPSPDLIIIDPPWWDIENAAATLATRYGTFIAAVQSGSWASVPIVMCTAHPASGQTVAQTSGAFAAFGPLNAAIATLRAASPATRYVADLAALTSAPSGGTSSAITERALWMAQKAPDFDRLEGGGAVANYWGGHFVCNWKGVADYNAGWTSAIPRDPAGNMLYPPPGGTGLMDFSRESGAGPTNRFVQSAAGITPWYWIYPMAGHAASNTCVEVRNGFAAGLRIGGGWEFFFSGSRFGDTGTWWNGTGYAPGNTDGRSRWGQRSDGLTTWHAPRGNVGMEVWPRDTVPSRGILEFNGGFNRDLLVNSRAWFWGAQCRLALIDPGGVDDRSSARFGVKCGGDIASTLGGMHYDRFGWPYNMQDIGSDSWTRVTWADWQMVSSLPLGREGSPSNGPHPEFHWNDQGAPGPMFGWSPPTPFNDPSADRSLTASQFRTIGLPVPPHWEGASGVVTGGAGSGYPVTDYWLPGGGSRLYLLVQSGADKVARVIASEIIRSGVLASFTGGGITFEPLPGAATRPNVFLSVVGGNVNVDLKNWTASTPTGPQWQTTALAPASAGAPYSFPLVVLADPAPTFSILEGPSWLSIGSSSGVLAGTAPGTQSDSSVVVRATNGVGGPVDRVFTVSVVAGVLILTATLPAAIQGQTYLAPIEVTGPEPLTLTASGLPAGLALVGRNVTGTPTNAAGGTVLLTLTPATGSPVTRTIVVAGGIAGDLPTITTATLPDGTVGLSYSQPLAATGAGPITWSVASGTLPPGLAIAGSVVAGTPAAPGGYGVRLRATNALGVAERDITININAAGAVAPIASPWARWTRN
jgi:hypothetical protein